MSLYNDKKSKDIEGAVTVFVVNQIYKNFTEHYFQMVMLDLINIVNNAEKIHEDTMYYKYGYLIGVTSDQLFDFLAEYLENDERTCFEYEETYSEESIFYDRYIRNILNSKRFINTLNNFIEYEKKKYGIISEKSTCESTVASEIEWKDE